MNLPDSVWRVVPLLLTKFVDGVINGGANFVAYLTELFTKGEAAFVLVPVLVPFVLGFRVKLLSS